MKTAAVATRYREHFPTLRDATYLVSHSMGAAPLGARAALEDYWARWSKDGPEAWAYWLPQIGRIADGIGEIIGAPPGSMFLAPNVSTLQAAIASSLRFEPERNEVVCEALQFPSVTYVWKAWERYGAVLRTIPSDDGRTLETERIVNAITERTAVAALSHAYYVSGALCDVKAIAARCRETGTILVLDAYQTTGVYPYNVVEDAVDIVVGGSHKWLCGGPGCGWLYVRAGLHARFEPAVTGWFAHADPFAFEPAPLRYAESMYRWATGTPTSPGYIIAKAGHDLIRAAGVAAIREHNVALTTRIAEAALERGLTVNTPLDPAKRAGWIGIDFPNSERVCQALIAQRVFVDYRPGCGIRVGPHIYTSTHDVDSLFTTLDALRGV